MAQDRPLLCAAGNVEVPAYLALIQKGYTVTSSSPALVDEGWYADKDGLSYQAGTLIELLGLVSMYEVRGPRWAAKDREIDAFLLKYET